MANGDAPPRIFKITYRSAINGRVVRVFAKVPYGGLFDLTDKLSRMVTERQILWFRLDVAKPKEIAEHRSTLGRWLGALAESSAVTKVDWLA
jgi:hypothetical protein